MPIYDYVCSNCTTRTEFIHGIDAPQPRFCPSCGAEGTLRKAFVAPSVHFKGSGWAKKDRSSSSASRTKAASGSDSGSSDGAGASSGSSGSSGDGGTKASSDADSKKSADSSTSKSGSGSTSSEA